MRRPYRLLSSHTPSNSKLYSHTTAKLHCPTPRPWPRGGPISGRNSEVLLYFALSLLLVDVSARATTTEVVAAPAFQIPLGVKPKPLVGIVKRGRKSEGGRTKSPIQTASAIRKEYLHSRRLFQPRTRRFTCFWSKR